MRTQLTPFPRYDDADRDFFYSTLAEIGFLLLEKQKAVVFDATANRRAYRDAARKRIARFAEVFVDTPLEVCAARDPKGLYRKGHAGALRAAARARARGARRRRHAAPTPRAQIVALLEQARLALKKKITAGVVALAACGLRLVLFILGPKVEVVEAVRREVVQSVVATGRIESPFRVDIGAQVVGTVTRVPVAQGESGCRRADADRARRRRGARARAPGARRR